MPPSSGPQADPSEAPPEPPEPTFWEMGLGLVDSPTLRSLVLCPQPLALGPQPHLVCPSGLLFPLPVSLAVFPPVCTRLVPGPFLPSAHLGIRHFSSELARRSCLRVPQSWSMAYPSSPDLSPQGPHFHPQFRVSRKPQNQALVPKQEWVQVLNLALGTIPVTGTVPSYTSKHKTG